MGKVQLIYYIIARFSSLAVQKSRESLVPILMWLMSWYMFLKRAWAEGTAKFESPPPSIYSASLVTKLYWLQATESGYGVVHYPNS